MMKLKLVDGEAKLLVPRPGHTPFEIPKATLRVLLNTFEVFRTTPLVVQVLEAHGVKLTIVWDSMGVRILQHTLNSLKGVYFSKEEITEFMTDNEFALNLLVNRLSPSLFRLMDACLQHARDNYRQAVYLYTRGCELFGLAARPDDIIVPTIDKRKKDEPIVKMLM